MSTSTVMIATDFTPLAETAHRAGLSLAKAVGAHRVHFEHIVQNATAAAMPTYGFATLDIDRIYQEIMADAERRIHAIEVPLENVTVTRHVRTDVLGRGLIRASEDIKADWVVVASHGYGAFKRAFLGSAASALVRGADCPVLVVGEGRELTLPPKRILVAVDLSYVSEAILRRAISLAGPDTKIDVLSMYENPLVTAGNGALLPQYLSPQELEHLAERHEAQVQALVDRVPHPGVTVTVKTTLAAKPSQAILDFSTVTRPELICIGTSGHSAWNRFLLGSTATRVLHEALFPVLVIPNGALR